MSEFPILNAILDLIIGVDARTKLIVANQEKEMTALADLQAAEVTIQAAVNAAIALIQKLQAGTVAAADVEAVVTQLNAASTALSAAVMPPGP